MSFFILDPDKNSVSDNVVPTGTSSDTANIVITTTLIAPNVQTPNPTQETYTLLNDTGTSYVALSTDNTIEVASATYADIILPTSMGIANKKYIIMRSFTGSSVLTIRTYSMIETIDGLEYAELFNAGDIIELVADGNLNWRTY